ncbi:MAG: PQQ-binding-like beta-propeller repeat protein [Acidobacteria bacterium]|nr:PQQ-binding-like beta-propeller repeat protein [Acidobacteriota bacterium]
MKKLLIVLSAFLLGIIGLASMPQPLAIILPDVSANWPQWRGPQGQGISTEKGLPTEWSATMNVMWKTPIAGRGHSSPIIWGDRIFLTTAVEGEVIPGAMPPKHRLGDADYVHPDSVGATRHHTLKVICLDRRSGKLLWERTAYSGRVYDDRHRKATYADGTPVTDGAYVYAWFGSEGLYCYNLSGKLIWKKSLGPIATQGMGNGTSPVLYQNLVILQCDEDNGEKSFVIALDKRNGKEVWRTARQVQVSWSTPVIARTPAREELVASGNEHVISYDPATGKELWRSRGTQSWTVSTPLIGHGIVVVSAAHPVKRAIAIRLGGSGDVTDTPQVIWQRDKGTGYTPSSILYGDYVYLMTDRGILTCMDVRTGEVKYEGGRVPKPATFSASPVAYEEKILLSSEDGDIFVLRAGPKYEVLRTNSLDEPIYASPAIANGNIFIRTTKHLYCIANGEKK